MRKPLDILLKRVTQLALHQFVATLCDNRDCDCEPAHGMPPSRGYIEQKEFATEPWTAKTPITAWTIENYDNVIEVEPFTKWDKPTVSGMFFDCLIGYWGVSTDWKRVSINWHTGPRFGRGYVHPVLESPSGILYLGNRMPTWVS